MALLAAGPVIAHTMSTGDTGGAAPLRGGGCGARAPCLHCDRQRHRRHAISLGGISQPDNKLVVQAAFKPSHKSGFYVLT